MQAEIILVSEIQLRNLIRDEILTAIKPDNKFLPDLTDVTTIASEYGIAKQTLYAKHSRGEIPAGIVFKKGKKLFFSRIAFDDWIRSK